MRLGGRSPREGGRLATLLRFGARDVEGSNDFTRTLLGAAVQGYRLSEGRARVGVGLSREGRLAGRGARLGVFPVGGGM